MNFSFWLGQQAYTISLEEKGKNVLQIALGGRVYEVSVEFVTKEVLLLRINGKVYNVVVNSNSRAHSVYVNGRLFRVEKQSGLRILTEERERPRKKEVRITMPGRVVQVMAREGEEVQLGQPVLVLEAMKMQNEIKSPQKGKIIQINFRAGDYVEAGAVLFSVE